MKVKITGWKGVAGWRWNLPNDDICSICRNQYDSTCSACRLPGDGCPVGMGLCGHAFHTHCILSWITEHGAHNSCPLCRQTWTPKDGSALSRPPPPPRVARPPVVQVAIVIPP